MIETNGLYSTGIESGAIDGDAVMVGVFQCWQLIGSPPATSESSYFLIFWEPFNQDNCKPTFDKVVHNSFCFLFTNQLHKGWGLHPCCRQDESNI
jgi:hypothetical protein